MKSLVYIAGVMLRMSLHVQLLQDHDHLQSKTHQPAYLKTACPFHELSGSLFMRKSLQSYSSRECRHVGAGHHSAAVLGPSVGDLHLSGLHSAAHANFSRARLRLLSCIGHCFSCKGATP